MKIEKGIPLPTRRSGGAYKVKYPWREMESGDSVLIEVPEGMDVAMAQRRFSNSAREFVRAHRPGWSVRTARENGSVRVWLIGPASLKVKS